MATIECIRPDWHALPGVQAYSTTRIGGGSRGPWQGLNLATHVGDDPAQVIANRRLLVEELALPGLPYWLEQVHGVTVVDVGDASGNMVADASFSCRAGEVCVVMTADCLPVLFADAGGAWVAAAHAGWRGLLAGVLERTLDRFAGAPGEVHAWLGPAIGAGAFEVGDEVRDAFVAADPGSVGSFAATRPGHCLADLYGLARRRLQACGVRHISGGDHCTYRESDLFYSYRRDVQTGRMASLVWLQPD